MLLHFVCKAKNNERELQEGTPVMMCGLSSGLVLFLGFLSGVLKSILRGLNDVGEKILCFVHFLFRDKKTMLTHTNP